MAIGNVRTASASSVGDCTLAVVVGIGRHADEAFDTLPAAPAEALAIANALIDPLGCRLQLGHIACLRDHDATRVAILNAIAQACKAATSDHSLFIYFAGHGIDVGGQFALIAFDTHSQDPAGTGITAQDLERVLQGVKARGVFLVLDCCGGASLAEGAPGFFRATGNTADHRILLSAARAGQPSREGPKGSAFSQALIEALTGREQLGVQPGTIYFSDLYRFLHDRVTVDAETTPDGEAAQEPMATASMARDPLLFLHSGLTLAQVKVRTQRYSRRDMRAMLTRVLIGTGAAAATAVLGLWVYIAGHHFLRVEDGVLALYRGHPTLRVLTYPRLVWQYDVRPDEIAASSPLASAQPLVSGWGQPFKDEPLRHLTPSGQARWQINGNQVAEARTALTAQLDHSGSAEQDPYAALLAIGISEAKQADLLQRLAASARPEVSTAAMARLMNVAPDRGAAIAETMGFGLGTRGTHLQVMAELPPGCTPGTQRYLDGFAAGPGNGQFARLQIDAALHTGCMLSDQAAATIGEPLFLGLLARYLSIADPPRGAGLQQAFLQAFTAHLNGAGAPISLHTAAGYLAGAPAAATCPEVRSLDQLPGTASKLAAARALVWQCPPARMVLVPGADAATFQTEVLAAGQATNRIVVAQHRFDGGTGDLMTILDALRMGGANESSASLERLALSHPNTSVRRHAVRLLRLANLPAKGTLASFESTGDSALQTEAYLWHAQQDRSQVLARVRSRLSDDNASFLPMLVARLALSPDEAREVLRAAESAQVSERTRAALTGMLADASTVAEQLGAPNAKRRAWVGDWLAWRNDLQAIAALLPAKPLPGQLTARNLQLVADRRAAIDRELAPKTPLNGNDDDSWRIRLMLDLRQIPETGLRAWLQARCRWCD